jgi:hypothetical protein
VLKKLNLDGTKTYETALACSEVSNMLDALLSGRTSNISIGSEQGDIAKWDDFVIQEADGSLIHVQAKRNNTDFSDHSPTRGTITKGKNKGNLYDLSPLDDSMKSLGEWIATVNLASLTPKRKFRLEVADGQVQIKGGITVNHLRTLCNDQIKDITNDAGFTALVTADQTAAKIVEWLVSWCGFKDNSHILSALKLLTVSQTGNVTDIEQRSIQTLSTKFSQPNDVYNSLKGFINDNSTFTTAITPRIALEPIKSFLLPTILNWTQYQQDETIYSKCGTHDLTQGNIETPSVVVPYLWDTSKTSLLKLDAPVNISEKLPQAIVRLALHLQSGTMAHLTNHAGWSEATKTAVGGTLGIDKTDFDSINAIQCTGISVSSDSAKLSSLTDQENEAEVLNDEMQKVVWNRVCSKVHAEISFHDATPLRAAVETRWNHWKTALDADITSQKELCLSMLHPAAEGKDIVGHLRVGQKTAGLISRGLFTLLIVSVCLDGTDNSWNEVGSALTVSTNALRYWSGAHGEARRPRKLIENGRDKLLAAEPAKILILSEVEAAPTELRTVSLAHEGSTDKTLAAAREPQIIVTMCPKFSDLVRLGNIQNIKDYLQLQIN